MTPILVSIIGLALVAPPAQAAGAVAEVPFPAPSAGLYDMRRLNDYAAKVSWRFVHKQDSHGWVCGSQGSAVFLGGNLFLTAAHLVDQNPLLDDCAAFGKADPVVEFGPAELRSRVVTSAPWEDEDGLAYPDGMDLALLEVDARMIPVELRSAETRAICDGDLPAAAEVRIATEFGVVVASATPRSGGEFGRVDYKAKRGDSGGGVFDPARGCLLGIISSGGPEGANYVPNEILRRFVRMGAAPESKTCATRRGASC